MKLKEKYNRVRPSYLDSTLEPSIEVPNHPSYPSGHSTQIHTIVLFAKEKYPEFSEIYDEMAREYADNREYAGVHYKSDTVFGIKIAEYITSTVKNPIIA